MKRKELEQTINITLAAHTTTRGFDYESASKALTESFIQLSDERCKEQREICAKVYRKEYAISDHIEPDILNAPLPELI